MSQSVVGARLRAAAFPWLIAWAAGGPAIAGPVAIGRPAAPAPARDAAPAPRGAAPLFEPAGPGTGLLHAHETTPGLQLIAALHAAGGAAGDFNADGLHDLFVLGGGVNPDRMFVNNGDGTFTDRAAEWGLDRLHHAYGASAADFDADGDLDLFVASYGPSSGLPQRRSYLLLRNDGQGDARTFVDVATPAGLNNQQTFYVDGTGSGWGDYNLDGRLDLMVCGYRNQHAGNRLYRNDGPDGQGVWCFTDVTAAAGIESTAVQGFFPRFVDMDGDRHPEIILIADAGSSRYLVNNADGTFTRRNDLAPRLATANAMGTDVGDVNNDGLLDFYVTNITQFSSGNLLLVQNTLGTFDDRAAAAGVFEGYWGWGTLIADLDHDGHPDVAETNGGYGQFSNKPSLLYMNNGDGVTFTDRAQAEGFVHFGQGRGLVRMDLENDGDLDLVILCNNQPMAVFRNTLIGPDGLTPPGANWLRVTLDTGARPGLAPRGIGSLVRVRSAQGERIAPVDNASNHCTTSPAEAHFGLAHDAHADAVRVEWADGTRTTLVGVPANQVLRVSAPFHPADFDGSGAVDAADAAAFVADLAAGSLAADVNGDWRVDFFDAALFITLLRDGL